LLGLVAFWLVAWLPLAAYCLLAMAIAPLRRPKSPALARS
jgi:hypothetical protein